jgi:hypothetical protein
MSFDRSGKFNIPRNEKPQLWPGIPISRVGAPWLINNKKMICWIIVGTRFPGRVR